MIKDNNVNKSILIVAHPDDEILWFSSIINKVDKIVCIFSDTKDKLISEGRKKIFTNKSLPYSSKLININIKEADVLNKSDWDVPKLFNYGIKNNVLDYKNNYNLICEKLKKEIISFDRIYTHNPWGEYGHEEHIQIFNAVSNIYNNDKQQIWVSGYFSSKSYKVMSITSNYLSNKNINVNIDEKFCEIVKKKYLINNAWTWANDYRWPSNEFFYKIKKRKDLKIKNQKPSCAFPPLNFILMTLVHLNYYSKLRSKLIFFFQKILPHNLFSLMIKHKKKF